MTRILLLSDTHGHMDDRILEYAAQADEIWHAGDIGTLTVADKLAAIRPLRAVFGNIDGHKIRGEYPLDNRFEVEGLQVWITHIGGYPGRYEARVRHGLADSGVGLFISGHSHILKVMYDKKHGLMHMNPGAAGKQGFHKVRTMLRFGIDQGELKDLEVIELGKRG
ncbi:hypothetical protein SAMN04490243_2624 [Robiginitalea myxolifaciens]|uniref:Phosphoesterase n=1 Tax=Robiginitalea myxolifaciens TaxID=400055 RepID=A0A1I6HDX4_9FLAO|nr:metallophosphoesterase family protein [Robiginitalea myxolifaciens]SFR52705.1 hypothetical protein SAMN04490243_2624 [Robiginitalea myxolifaciens]